MRRRLRLKPASATGKTHQGEFLTDDYLIIENLLNSADFGLSDADDA